MSNTVVFDTKELFFLLSVVADHCRLSLLPVEEDDNTYINAVYVDVSNAIFKFIQQILQLLLVKGASIFLLHCV